MNTRFKDPQPAASAPIKPVQLQVNNSGAWKTVVSFDAADEAQIRRIERAAEALHLVDAGSTFRIVTKEHPKQVLMHLDNHQWRVA